MRIQNNIMAMNTHRQLGINNLNQTKSTEKLSSGYRINRAADDAAGLSISEKMRAQIRGLNMASKNAQDGISLVQATEGALQESHSILQRMRELAVQAANEVNEPVDRGYIAAELTQLSDELTRISSTTTFNGKNVLGAGAGTLKLHVGANDNQTIDVTTTKTDATTLGLLPAVWADLAPSATVLAGTTAANATIVAVDTAINKVSSLRSDLGAVQNRLEHTVNNLDTVSENLQAAESRIRDVDMAKEMMAFTKNNILSQAATAMLAQANQAPQNVLSLLR